MRNKNNIRNIVCNYIKANGPSSWEELHKVILIAAGRNMNEKNWGNSYLDLVSNNSICFPSKDDHRYLIRSHVDGLYRVIVD